MGRKRSAPTPAPTPTPSPTVLSGTEGNDSLMWESPAAGTVDGRGGFDTLTISLGGLTTDLVMTGALGSGATALLSTGLTIQNIELLRIRSGGGNDRLFGGAGDDYFATGIGNDSVAGGGGNDWLDLAQGDNVASGGAGADTFFLLHDGKVTITDFSVDQGDKILFDINGLDIPTAWGIANGFIRITDSKAGAVLEVDFDGSSTAFDWSVVAVLQGVSAASLIPEAFAA